MLFIRKWLYSGCELNASSHTLAHVASIRASELEPEPELVAIHASDGTGQGMVIGSEAVKVSLAPLDALVALRARGSSESTASAESQTLSR